MSIAVCTGDDCLELLLTDTDIDEIADKFLQSGERERYLRLGDGAYRPRVGRSRVCQPY